MFLLLSRKVRKDLRIIVNQLVNSSGNRPKSIRNQNLRLAKNVPNKNMGAAISTEQKLSLDKPGTLEIADQKKKY